MYMKKIISAAAALAAAFTLMTGCSSNADDLNKETEPQTSSASESSEVSASESSKLSSDEEIAELLKTQIKAASYKDYDAFSKAMNAALMIEILSDSGNASAEIPPERAEEMTKDAYDRISAVFDGGFDGNFSDLQVQGEKSDLGYTSYLATFSTNCGICYATVFEKDSKFCAFIETEDIMREKNEATAKLAASKNADTILHCAEKAIEAYGAIPDGDYNFGIDQLTVTDKADNALDAFKAAVAKQFASSGDDSDKGEAYLLVKDGKPYVQWRSLERPDLIGEAPAKDDESFTPVWGKPAAE